MSPEELISRIVFRDANVLVVDKPAGLPVHPGPKGGETLFDHLDSLRFGLPRRPEIAHRLDRETSGCLTLGRHTRAIARLNELFRNGTVEKTYWALVDGELPGQSGRIDLALAPRDPDRGWWMKPDPAGQPASTEWRVLRRSGTAALLELKPLTGRTHQLRVHCASSGFPIIGDAIYGGAARQGGPPLMLHARGLRIPFHPRRPAILAEADPPLPMHAAIACLPPEISG
jgi:tRNA pseudouridine32 synthase/23S rRNA pseudouridine746 synthase